jgi:hypothetical protein
VCVHTQTLRSTTEQSSEVLQRIQGQKAALEVEIASVASELSTAQRHLTVLRQSEAVRTGALCLSVCLYVCVYVCLCAYAVVPGKLVGRGR